MLNRKKPPSTPALPTLPSYQDVITESSLHPHLPITTLKTGSPFITLRISRDTTDITKPGFSSLLAEMLPKCQVSNEGEPLAAYIEGYGAEIAVNSFRGGIVLKFMAAPDCFIDLIPALLSALYQPRFTSDHLTSTKQELKAKWHQEEANPRMLAHKTLWKNIFGEAHPLGYQAKPAQIDRVTVDALSDYNTQVWAHPSLYLSGRVDDTILDKLAAHFPPLLPNTAPPKKHPVQPGALQQTISRPDMPQAYILMGHHTIAAQHPDSIPLSITNELLGGFFSSRLMRNVREKQGYTYSISSRITTCPTEAVWMLGTSVKGAHADATLEAIQAEITDLQQHPIGEEELTLLKKYLLGDLLGMLNGPLAFEEHIHYAKFFGKGLTYYHDLYEGIQAITPKTIQRMAQQHLGLSTCHQVIVR